MSTAIVPIEVKTPFGPFMEQKDGRCTYFTIDDFRGMCRAKGYGTQKLLDQIDFCSRIGGYVAGGFMESMMNGKPPKDIDMLFRDQDQFLKAKDMLEKSGYAMEPADADIYSAECRWVNMRPKDDSLAVVQLIKVRWYENERAVLDSFDFTCTQFAVVFGSLIFNPLALIDVCKRRLSLNRLTFPADTLRRMVKYTNKKGYTACQGFLIDLTRQIHDHVRENGLGPVNVFYLD